jgi:threonine dehydratase
MAAPPGDDLVPLEAVRAATELIRGWVKQTPMATSESLAAMFGGRLELKAELFQQTGSFKVRGILHRMLRLSPEQRQAGVVTVSAGNAAAALAWSARQANTPATVVMPATAVPAKIEATRGYGAEVILADGDLFETFEAVRDERGLTAIHPFDDLDVIAGHGSLALELLRDRPEVETVLVPVGGGGLISGVAVTLKAVRTSVRVIGVEPASADVVSRSLAAGAPQRLPTARSVADGLAAPVCGVHTLAHIQRCVDEMVRVGEDSIVAATRLLIGRTKLAVEPAAAAPVAALLEGSVRLHPDHLTVAVLSGGNLDVSTVLAGR